MQTNNIERFPEMFERFPESRESLNARFYQNYPEVYSTEDLTVTRIPERLKALYFKANNHSKRNWCLKSIDAFLTLRDQ